MAFEGGVLIHCLGELMGRACCIYVYHYSRQRFIITRLLYFSLPHYRYAVVVCIVISPGEREGNAPPNIFLGFTHTCREIHPQYLTFVGLLDHLSNSRHDTKLLATTGVVRIGLVDTKKRCSASTCAWGISIFLLRAAIRGSRHYPRSGLFLLSVTALATVVKQSPPSVCPSFRLFPFCLRNRLAVDLELLRVIKSRP